MKKILLSIFLFIGVISNVNALEDKTFYLPERNTYYQRSQHTYSFLDKNNELRTAYAPSIYTLLSDLEQAKNEEIWTFTDTYTIPWSVTNNDYFIVYCADIVAPVEEQLGYRQINIGESTYINEDIKTKLVGILKNSYPYISKDAMIKKLIDANVLEYIDTNYGKVLTAVGNTAATSDITVDELVSATQMALSHYTNPGSIQEMYYYTYRLSARSVLRSHNLWTNEYSSGDYDFINNNIQAVYNYLITLEDEVPVKTTITKITANKNVDQIYVYINNNITDKDNFTLKTIENGGVTNTYNLTSLNQREDKSYIIPTNNINDVLNVDIELSGSDYVENNVFVYEALNGADITQTLIGVSSGSISIASLYTDPITEEVPEVVKETLPKNPPTGFEMNLAHAGGIILISSLVLLLRKKKSFFKI